MSTLIAVPSMNPGGLAAPASAHFGHCDLYTLVEVEGDQVKSVTTMANPPHQEGGCLAPVGLLAQRGVQKLLAGGMGRRPLMGFQEAGIEVLITEGEGRVGEAVEAYLDGRLPTFTMDSVCGGGGHCHG